MTEYRPVSIREVSKRITSWEDFRVFFYEWLDDFYLYPECRVWMATEEIVPTYDNRLDAFMAAAVHHLYMKNDLEIPRWVFRDRYYLKDPWFRPAYISVRPIQIVESPGPFRARNIFVFEDVLERV